MYLFSKCKSQQSVMARHLLSSLLSAAGTGGLFHIARPISNCMHSNCSILLHKGFVASPTLFHARHAKVVYLFL
jgi:hypothetical protein